MPMLQHPTGDTFKWTGNVHDDSGTAHYKLFGVEFELTTLKFAEAHALSAHLLEIAKRIQQDSKMSAYDNVIACMNKLKHDF